MAKFAGLPWDLVLSAELFEHYKPDPETYLGAARLLGLAPRQVMMVAAHNNDLKAAQKLGLKTAFVARPTEYGPLQKLDFEATGDWDIVARDFGGIAEPDGMLGQAIELAPACRRRGPCQIHASNRPNRTTACPKLPPARGVDIQMTPKLPFAAKLL